LTRKQAAQRAQVHINTIDKWIRIYPDFPASRMGPPGHRPMVRIWRDGFDRFLQSLNE
jgi:hypothetical protein